MSLKHCPEAVGITEESLGVFSDKLNYSPLLSYVLIITGTDFSGDKVCFFINLPYKNVSL